MRHARILVEGAWYHVTARVNRRESLFQGGGTRELFLAFLARARKRHRFQVANFCVMGNHIHLLLRPGRRESLSAIMRWLLGGFARAYNRLHGLTGHFWGDRFHSRTLDGIRGIAIVFDYIDLNPVKAGLVSRPCDWRHGGAWHARARNGALEGPDPPWLTLLKSLRVLPVAITSRR